MRRMCDEREDAKCEWLPSISTVTQLGKKTQQISTVMCNTTVLHIN